MTTPSVPPIALAGEPVAWMYRIVKPGTSGVRLLEKRAEAPEGGWKDYVEIPLYAAPSPSASSVPSDCDVRKILLKVVPGDGDGLEIYAKNVEEVESLLSEMGERIETFEASANLAPSVLTDLPDASDEDKKSGWKLNVDFLIAVKKQPEVADWEVDLEVMEAVLIAGRALLQANGATTCEKS